MDLDASAFVHHPRYVTFMLRDVHVTLCYDIDRHLHLQRVLVKDTGEGKYLQYLWFWSQTYK